MGLKSDGSTASYYELPDYATQLQHLISYRNMNGQLAEIFRACYRYGLVDHSSMLRDAKKIKFYAEAEIERLERIQQHGMDALKRAKEAEVKLRLKMEAAEAQAQPRWKLTPEEEERARELAEKYGLTGGEEG